MQEILEELYEETKKLQGSIELAEMLSRSSDDLILEHLVKKIVNVKVKMYKEHHHTPHVHIDIANQTHAASISIETQEILAGSVNRKYEKIVKEWINKNKANLLVIWNNIQKGQVFDLTTLT